MPAEFKQVIKYENSLITLDEVRYRIVEMPERIQALVDHPDIPIKGNRW